MVIGTGGAVLRAAIAARQAGVDVAIVLMDGPIVKGNCQMRELLGSDDSALQRPPP